MPHDHQDQASAMNAYEVSTNVVGPDRAHRFLSPVGGRVGFRLQPVDLDLLLAGDITGVECRANPLSAEPALRRIARYGLDELIVTRLMRVFRRHYTRGQFPRRIKLRRSERGVQLASFDRQGV